MNNSEFEKLILDSVRDAIVMVIRRSLEISGMLNVDENPELVKDIVSRIQALLSIVSSRLTLESKLLINNLERVLEKALDLYDNLSKAVEGTLSIDVIDDSLKTLENEVNMALEVQASVEGIVNRLRRGILVSTLAALTLGVLLISYTTTNIIKHGTEIEEGLLYVIPAIIGLPSFIAFIMMLQNRGFTNYSITIILPLTITAIGVSYSYNNVLVEPTLLIGILAGVFAILTTIVYLIRWNVILLAPRFKVSLELRYPKAPERIPRVLTEKAPEKLVTMVRKAYIKRYGPTGDDILRFELRNLIMKGLSEAEAYRELARRLGLGGENIKA